MKYLINYVGINGTTSEFDLFILNDDTIYDLHIKLKRKLKTKKFYVYCKSELTEDSLVQ